MSLQPLPYSRFIEIVYLLEAYIPAFPDVGREFLIFRWGRNGYNSKPGGPRIAFLHREKHEMVTEMEIAKFLRIMDIPEEDFLAHADGCMVNPSVAESSGPSPSTDQGSPDKS